MKTVINTQGTGNCQLVWMGFSKEPGRGTRVQIKMLLKSLVKLSGAEADEIIEGLRQNRPYVLARDIPENMARPAAQNAIKAFGIDAKVIVGAEESLTFDAQSVRAQLQSGDRAEALKMLVQAAQWNEEAIDILVEEALERGDVVQADHWETKRAQIKASAAAALEKPQAQGGGSGTWAGFGVSMPMDGGF